MNIIDINPHLRFASSMRYDQAYSGKQVKVTDYRIFYVTEGSAQMHIDSVSYQLTAHSLFYCCAGSKYIIEASEGFSLYTLNFDLTQANSHATFPYPTHTDPAQWAQMPVFFQSVADSPFLNGHLFLPNASPLRSYLETIIAEASSNAPLCRELSGTTLKSLLIELHRLRPSDLAPKIAFIKDYIQQNYAQDITNKDLAELVGYHEYYLNRVFAKHMGTNLHNYLLKVRLNHACFLILNTDLNLNAIPELVGFRNYPHFSSYFKQTYGCSPAQYRKQLKESI